MTQNNSLGTKGKTCMKCGAADPEYDYHFVVVSSHTDVKSKYSLGTTTTTTTTLESFLGADRYVVCENCIKKSRNTTTAIAAAWIAALAAFLVFNIITLSSFPKGIAVLMLILLAVLAVGAFWGVYTLFKPKDNPIIAKKLLRKERKLSDEKSRTLKEYIPIDNELYIDKKTGELSLSRFKEINKLQTEMAENIFNRFILPGNGAELVDQMLSSGQETK